MQEAELRAEHERRVKRVKAKLYSTWWGLSFFFYSALVVLYMVEWYWLMPAVFTFPLWLLVRAHTTYADQTYQEGVTVGLSLGSKAALDGYQHVMGHIQAGEEPCEDAYKLNVKIPRVWEHEFVYAEMLAVHEPAVDQDEFNAFMRDIGTPQSVQDRVNLRMWGTVPVRDDDEPEPTPARPKPPLPSRRKIRRTLRKTNLTKEQQAMILEDLERVRQAEKEQPKPDDETPS